MLSLGGVGGDWGGRPDSLAHDIISGLGSALEQDMAFNTSLPSDGLRLLEFLTAWIKGLGPGRGGPQLRRPVLRQHGP